MNSSILLEAADLAIGQSKKIVCVFCNAKHEHSLSITRYPNEIKYNCFRAKCGKSGSIQSIANALGSRREAAVLLTPYTGGLGRSAALDSWIYEKYGCAGEFKMGDLGRLAHTICDSEGKDLGHWLKKLPGSTFRGPKAMNYWHSPGAHIHYCRAGKQERIVLVEDIISAEKVDAICPAAALLGVDMSMDVALDLQKVTSKLILALDPNATDKAIKIKRRYGFMFDISIVEFPADPKNCSYDLIESMLLCTFAK